MTGTHVIKVNVTGAQRIKARKCLAGIRGDGPGVYISPVGGMILATA